MRYLAMMFVLFELRAETIHWPGFRGVAASGVADSAAPSAWNADTSAGPVRNILWSVPLPGLSHSSPAIWGQKLFVLTAVSKDGNAPLKVGLYGSGDSAADMAEQSWDVYCLDKRTGKTLWRRTAFRGVPKVKRHTKAAHANTTIATDGKHVVAFLGSEGLYVYSVSGDLLWKKDMPILDMGPEPDLQWGFASSPVIYRNTIVLQADCKRDPFLAVLAVEDGREIWKTPRQGVSDRSWASPAVFAIDGRTQVVTNGWPYIAGYDYQTGKELWRLKSEGDIPVPTPVAAHGLIFVTNAHGGWAPLYAIRPGAAGDISLSGEQRANQYVAWSEPRNGAYMQTPLIYQDLLYSCSDRGVLKVYDARTGQRRYEQRLGTGATGFSASPVAADGKVYFTSEEGEVFVVKAGPAFELLGKNAMGEISMATPAVSEGALYYHTRERIVAIRGR